MFDTRYILCVEDNQDSCEMINFMLRQADKNYSVTFVRTAENALEVIKTRSFDLYILDGRLPNMSGIELCPVLREKSSTTPIMFFTAMAYRIDRETAMKAGATEYLVKPTDLGIFTQTVKKLLTENSQTYTPTTQSVLNYGSDSLW